MNGPRRLRDDPAFLAETGVDLSAEAELLAPHDLARLKRRVTGAVARGQVPRLSPTRGGPGLGVGHWLALVAIGGAVVGALGGGEPGAPSAPAEVARTQSPPVSSPVPGAPAATDASPTTSGRPPSTDVASGPLAEPVWTEVARALPAAATVPADPQRRPARARRDRLRPLAATAAPAAPTHAVAVKPPEPAALGPERDLRRPADVPWSAIDRSATLDKDLLDALAESLRRKTFK